MLKYLNGDIDFLSRYDINNLDDLTQEINALLSNHHYKIDVKQLFEHSFNYLDFKSLINNMRRSLYYCFNNDLCPPTNSFNYYELNLLEWFFTIYCQLDDLIIDYLKDLNNYDMKNYRVKNHVMTLLNNCPFCYFVTFTFDDETLQKNTYETRRKYINNLLKKHSYLFVCNVDYGKENGREHYHALIGCKNDLYLDKYKNINKKGKWETRLTYAPFNKKGLSDIELVYYNDSKAITKYINKFTNHAIKDTTKHNRVFYSKNYRLYDIRSTYQIALF